MIEQVMDALVFWPSGAGLSSATDLQYDPDGLSVAVKQGRGGRSGQLSQRRHTEKNGPPHQRPTHRAQHHSLRQCNENSAKVK